MKNFLVTVAGILLFIAIVLGALSLIRNLFRQPSVILTSTECSPPCWYSIIPGQTSAAQVYATLDQLVGVDKDSILGDYGKNNASLTEIYWYFQRPVQDNAGSITFNDERVSTINILTVNSLKLVELFEKLGQPEKYWTKIGYGENREFLDVFLLYPTKGYVAEVVVNTEAGSNQIQIKETTPVYRVTYFAPEMFQELSGTKIPVDRAGTFQPWLGFGAISFERR